MAKMPEYSRTAHVASRTIVGLFMVVGALIRLGLFVLDADRALHQPWPLAQALGLGALYDLAVARWWALPLTLPA